MHIVFLAEYIMLSDTQSFAATLVELLYESLKEMICKIYNGSISDIYNEQYFLYSNRIAVLCLFINMPFFTSCEILALTFISHVLNYLISALCDPAGQVLHFFLC